ncbi:hypothetical protein CEXT_80991 [Caerostris extrusa]|uniref:Uncharacterized protein n=1 Tax=Caerostris extrusa TaxID=172846 RepID=A0AAV4M359_CAEEX|nr:hypothetical protein CEXT_80991 [Caerostris extrusa]
MVFNRGQCSHLIYLMTAWDHQKIAVSLKPRAKTLEAISYVNEPRDAEDAQQMEPQNRGCSLTATEGTTTCFPLVFPPPFLDSRTPPSSTPPPRPSSRRQLRPPQMTGSEGRKLPPPTAPHSLRHQGGLISEGSRIDRKVEVHLVGEWCKSV